MILTVSLESALGGPDLEPEKQTSVEASEAQVLVSSPSRSWRAPPVQKVVAAIEKQHEQADDIQEQQEEMIDSFRNKMDAAVEKTQKKLLEKAR